MRYWKHNPLRDWRLNSWWRRNPPIKDPQGNLLTEQQVRLISKYLDEIQKGWHSHEWFIDLLKMGEDAQVVRYILKNVDWGFSTGRGTVSPHILKEVTSYLDAIDEDRFPDIVLDTPLLEALIETRNQFPLFVEERVNQLEGALYNLQLAERLEESRESINALKNKVITLQKEIEAILATLEEEKKATTAEPSPVEQEISVCGHCSNENFEWLEVDERSDVVDISHDNQIAKLQHRLRHAVMKLRDAITSHRAKPYIFDIEDDIEEIHAKIERLRATNRYRKNSYYRYNPFL